MNARSMEKVFSTPSLFLIYLIYNLLACLADLEEYLMSHPPLKFLGLRFTGSEDQGIES